MKKLLQTISFGIALTTSIEAAVWHEWDPSVGNGHFYAVTDTAMNWFDARSEASNAGGYLTSIGSIAELDFIRTTFGRSELFWTGLSTINGNNVFEWDSGEPITFTYFGAHQPDASQTSSVVINHINSRGFTRGFFFDAQPTQLYRGIIESSTDPNAQIPDDPTNPVPDGGATAILLGAGLVGTALYRGRRR
jgi:hypothetical protein